MYSSVNEYNDEDVASFGIIKGPRVFLCLLSYTIQFSLESIDLFSMSSCIADIMADIFKNRCNF